MDRRPLLLVAALAAAVFAGAVPGARADRLGGNYRGPDDVHSVREDPAHPPAPRPGRAPLVASFRLDLPFLVDLRAGRHESAFRGRPLLVLFVMRGCDDSAAAAGAFADGRVRDLAARFVPVLADAEKEEVFGVEHRVRTIPTLLLLDASGRETARAEGAADADRVAVALREGLRKAGRERPSPRARELEKAAGTLARAREAGDWRRILAAAEAVEAVGHEGPEAAEARAAREEAAAEAEARLDAARRMIRDGERSDARKALEKVAEEFAGIEESEAAVELLEEVAPSSSSIRRVTGAFRTTTPPAGTMTSKVPNSADLSGIPGFPSDPAPPETPEGTVEGPPPPPPPPIDDP